MNLNSLQPLELMKLHNDIITELERRDIVRTRNQPIAGYARWLIKRMYNLTYTSNPSDKYDFINSEGEKYIIKSRQIVKNNYENMPFSIIRNIEEHNFDYLVTVVFNMDFEILHAYRISINTLLSQNHHNTHQNGYVLRPKDVLSFQTGSEDIKTQLVELANQDRI